MFNNYFELFNCEETFEIDQDLLHKNYLKLQELFHPDKQINKLSAEKIKLLEYSALINEAYKTLSDDKKRAEYLLSLKKIFINREKNNSISPCPSMLNEIIELSESSNSSEILEMQKQCITNFKNLYLNQKLEEAAQEIIKLQYLTKIQHNIIQ